MDWGKGHLLHLHVVNDQFFFFCNKVEGDKIPIYRCSGFVQVMENLESHGIYEFHFQAWKVMEFNCRSLKVIEN